MPATACCSVLGLGFVFLLINGYAHVFMLLSVVVVSQWVTMLTVVNRHLVKEGFNTCTIRSDVPVKQRSETVDSFKNDRHGPSVSDEQMLLLIQPLYLCLLCIRTFWN